MSSSGTARITERLDALYEFDCEPVTEANLQGIGNFIGMYAGEHVAGTEFVIGPLFVAHGVSAPDLFTGLVSESVINDTVARLLGPKAWVVFDNPDPFIIHLLSIPRALG